METEGAPQNQDLLMIVQNSNKNLTVSHIVSKVMFKSHLNINPYSTNWVQNIWEGLITSWWILGHSIHCLTILCQTTTVHTNVYPSVAWNGLWLIDLWLIDLDMTMSSPIKSYKTAWGKTTTFSRYSILVNIHMWLSAIQTRKNSGFSFD